jgi:hypothetical protein
MLSHPLERPSSLEAPPYNNSSVPIGMATSNVRPTSTPKNCGGVTPMIVNGTRSTVSVRPIASAAPSKRRCQKP